MKVLIALCLLAACVDDPNDPNACGPAPGRPGIAIYTPGDGTVIMSLAQWAMLTTWMDETRAWTTCIESR